MEKTNDKNVAQLCTNIKLYIGRKVRTPKDFNFLSEIVLAHTHLYVSSTTLKRMWGYLHETTRARTPTLDVLSIFLGYEDWTDFCNTHTLFNPKFQEGTVNDRKVFFAELEARQLIEIKWLPNSCCTLEYVCGHSFKIVSSTNSNLRPGDIVNCCFIIESRSLYFIDSTINGHFYDVYCIGRTGGITFRMIG